MPLTKSRLPGGRVEYRTYEEWMDEANFHPTSPTARAWVDIGSSESWNAAIALAAYIVTKQAAGGETANVRDILIELGQSRTDVS